MQMKQKKPCKGKAGFKIIDTWKVGEITIVLGEDKYQLAIGHMGKNGRPRWNRYISRDRTK